MTGDSGQIIGFYWTITETEGAFAVRCKSDRERNERTATYTTEAKAAAAVSRHRTRHEAKVRSGVNAKDGRLYALRDEEGTFYGRGFSRDSYFGWKASNATVWGSPAEARSATPRKGSVVFTDDFGVTWHEEPASPDAA